MAEVSIINTSISVVLLTGITSLTSAIVAARAVRRGSFDIRQTSIEGLYLTRLAEVEKQLKSEKELTDTLRENALISQHNIFQLKETVDRLNISIRDQLADFLKCQQNIKLLHKALEEHGIPIVIDIGTIPNIAIPPLQK